MLETIRAGFSGINGWLALGTKNQGHSYILNPKGTPTRNVKYFLFKKLSSTSNYGHALNIVKEPKELSHTAALVKDNLMTVWVINQGDTEVPLKITPHNRRIKEKIIVQTRWTNSEEVEGVETQLEAVSKDYISGVVPPKSVCCFEIKLEPKF